MKNGGPWKIMQKSYPRNIYDVPEKKESYNEDSVLNDEPYQQYETDYLHEVEQVDGEDLESLHHIDVLPDEVDVSDVLQIQRSNSVEEHYNKGSSDEEDDTMINYDDDSDENDDEDEDEDEDEDDE
ncbi:uncharacterized protein LOC126675277 [Mercurialis annua]|uniref:uncharacterized protein LOC126675277 n=1 Tax=Mercurialis annua TaxID=3986 RepID=UPI00215FBC86|nr:uncharacterized protein LOC126675277 [Mercurialis annua]XP_050225848.1 uncharacterized protein LOC126675277 [Mercurialis annua]